MAERTVVGVDFSGAGRDDRLGKTWITEGRLEGRALTIDNCYRISRIQLTERLMRRDYAVSAMDFPFGVPIAFAKHWVRDVEALTDLWQAAHELDDRNSFRSMVDKFAPIVADELLRAGDLHISGCYSSLHRVSPNMLPMTFEGMKLLYALTKCDSFHVPPLPKPETNSPVLLEVMPGAALNRFGLPATNPGKAYKMRNQQGRNRRQEILDNLASKSSIVLCGLDDYRKTCLDNDDALDSIVATVVATLWVLDESESAFKIPSQQHTVADAFAKYRGTRKISLGIGHLTEEEAARKEGWIYVPKK